MSETVTVRLERIRLFNGYGRRVPFSWSYVAVHADGTRAEMGTGLEHVKELVRTSYKRRGLRVVFEQSW